MGKRHIFFLKNVQHIKILCKFVMAILEGCPKE